MAEEHDRERVDRLWHALDEDRSRGTAGMLVQFYRMSPERGKLGWRDMAQLVERAATSNETWTPSVSVVEFLREYLAGRGAERLVDPAAATPFLLIALADGDIAQQAVGFTALHQLELSLTSTDASRRVSWHDGWHVPPVASSTPRLGNPDLIVSAPPANMQQERVSYEVAGKRIVLNDTADSHVLMTALSLTDAGEALFLVQNGFLFRTGAQKARAVLAEAGLHVHACVDLVNAFRMTGAGFSLVALRKQPADATWVGQLSPHIDAGQLAQNLRSRKVGRTAELGRLVEWNAFQGFSRLAAGEQLERLVKRSGFPAVALTDVLRRPLVSPARGTGELIEPAPNTVYLPTFLNATVRSDSDAEALKVSGYVALLLDPSKALSEYVAWSLNGELGRALRASLSGGATLPSLRISSLSRAVLPLPPLTIQRQILSARQDIRDLQSALVHIEDELLACPRDVKRLQRQVREVADADPVKTWMEHLPFPLASIAWRYRADAEVKDKVEHLLRFFEASAMFYATILLSAFDSDPVLLESERANWGDKDGDLRLEVASFASWTKLGAAMAASARRLLANTEHDGALQAQTRAALTITSSSFIDLLTGKELWKSLDALTPERNDDAHGGIKGRAERAEKLARLEVEFTKLRQLTSEPMREVRLVRPGDGGYRKGVNQYSKAQDLSGFVDAFPTFLLESTQQLGADDLNLVDHSNDEPVRGGLKLAPLVRMGPAPSTQEDACYFYNRRKGQQTEFVSYHFEREARIPVSDTDLDAFLARLERSPPA